MRFRWSEEPSDALKGINSINVVVADLDDDIAKSGLSKSAIQTDVELKLRSVGLPVYDSNAVPATAGPVSALWVQVISQWEAPTSQYAYTIDVSIVSKVRTITASPELIDGALVWHRSVVGVIGADRVARIRGYIKDQIDPVLNDYLKANPKK